MKWPLRLQCRYKAIIYKVDNTGAQSKQALRGGLCLRVADNFNRFAFLQYIIFLGTELIR